LDIVFAINTCRLMLKPYGVKRGINIIVENISSIIDELSKLNSRVGLIVFSKQAYPLLDLTDKTNLVKETLNNLNVFGPYSDPVNAIKEAIYMFLEYWDEYSTKYIIIVPEVEVHRIRELEYIINVAKLFNIKVVNVILLTTSSRALSRIMSLQTKGVIIVKGFKELLEVLKKT